MATQLRERRVCWKSRPPEERGYAVPEQDSAWIEKVLQLYQIINLNNGLMLVGPRGSGKTVAWKVLLKALEGLEQIEGVAHVIDAKAMNKDALFGVMDPNTREWTDGLFTSIIRRIIDNVRGELDKRQRIIFDGDVDPEWVENLNSVLDDNKLLALPNGERDGKWKSRQQLSDSIRNTTKLALPTNQQFLLDYEITEAESSSSTSASKPPTDTRTEVIALKAANFSTEIKLSYSKHFKLFKERMDKRLTKTKNLERLAAIVCPRCKRYKISYMVKPAFCGNSNHYYAFDIIHRDDITVRDVAGAVKNLDSFSSEDLPEPFTYIKFSFKNLLGKNTWGKAAVEDKYVNEDRQFSFDAGFQPTFVYNEDVVLYSVPEPQKTVNQDSPKDSRG